MAQAKGSRGPPNYVHIDLLHRDNVGKEEKYMLINRNEHYQTNPYHCNKFFLKLAWLNSASEKSIFNQKLVSTLSEKPTEMNPMELQKRAKAFTIAKKTNKVSIFPESYTDDPVGRIFATKNPSRGSLQ